MRRAQRECEDVRWWLQAQSGEVRVHRAPLSRLPAPFSLRERVSADLVCSFLGRQARGGAARARHAYSPAPSCAPSAGLARAHAQAARNSQELRAGSAWYTCSRRAHAVRWGGRHELSEVICKAACSTTLSNQVQDKGSNKVGTVTPAQEYPDREPRGRRASCLDLLLRRIRSQAWPNSHKPCLPDS